MKNIVFDLGGVVFGRDPRKWEPEFMEFFAFIHAEKMPEFWVDYDRGTLTLDEGAPVEHCASPTAARCS